MRYQEISADVWKVFKKYLPEGSNLNTFINDVHDLNLKYESNMKELYFMNKLLKVYFDELNELKGVRKSEGSD